MASPALESRSANVSDIAELERQRFFRLTVWQRNAFLTLAVLLNLLVLVFIVALHVDTIPSPDSVPLAGYHVRLAFDSWQTYFWLFVFLLVQIGLGYHQFHKSLDGEGMTQLYPEDKTGDRKFGGFTGKQLTDMVQELTGRLKVGHVRRIVINDRPDPNAYTAHILGVGNIVVLHSNLLDIVPPEGVRAIVAHEVGHIRRKDSLVYLLAGIPRSFMFLLGTLILWKIGIGIFWFDSVGVLVKRVVFVILLWALAAWVLVRLNRVGNLASQHSEHLADAYAAHTCGWGTTLNALLLLGERTEAVHAVMKALEKQPHLKDVSITEDNLVRILKRLAPRELDDDKARRLAPRLYIEGRLVELRDTLGVPFSDEEIVALAERADRDLRKKQADETKETAEERANREREEQKKEAELEKLLVDWRTFDWDRSGHLDPKETAALVAELRANKRKMIFRQFLESDAEWNSHPTMRNRLLFLYDAFEKVRAGGSSA